MDIKELVKKIKKQSINKNPFKKKPIYEYSDFTQYHDKEFILNIYKAILGREPNKENLKYRLNQLRNLDKSKMELITILRASKEGRKNNVKILGFQKRFLLTLLYSIPPFKTVTKNSREIEQLKSRFKDNIDNLQQQIDSIDKSLQNTIEANETKKLYKSLIEERGNIQTSTNKLNMLINHAKTLLPPALEPATLLKIENQESKFDDLYTEFEDKFRGDSQEIKERLSVYLRFLHTVPKHTSNIEILDIACGRGEWLELLQENGYKARGIDLNQNMVDRSQAKNLNVQRAELSTHLKSLESNSLSLITGFHIIEHLDSFDEVLELLAESHRVLKSGGFIIYETPNPRNILVGSSDFFIDPSHKNPLHPMTMKFFTQKIGFRDVSAFIVNGNSLKDIDAIEFTDINDYIYTGRDYAVIGYKI